MSPEPALVIDVASPLGRRAYALLQKAGVSPLHAGPVTGPKRMLFVDAPRLELHRLWQAGARHVVHVEQASASVAQSPMLSVVRTVDDEREHELGSVRVSVSVLRVQLYFESLLPRLALALSSGRFLSAAPERGAAYVAHEDAALAAAALLASDGESPRLLHIAGPHVLSHEQLCAIASEKLERRIELEAVSQESLTGALLAAGLSQADAKLSAHADQLLRSQDLAHTSHDAARATGVATLSVPLRLEQERELLRRAAAHLQLPARASMARRSVMSCASATPV